MVDMQLLDKMNNLPLSKAVKPLLKNPEQGNLYLEQFLLEMMREILTAGVSKYWAYLYQMAIPLLESWTDRNPQKRYEQLTVNKDLEWADEMENLNQEMLEQAMDKNEAHLFENLLDCLRSNFNLEPEYPELL